MILKGISVNQDPPTKDHLWITPKGNTRFWDQSTWRLIGGSGGTVLPEIEAAGKYLATTGTSGNYSMVWVDGTGGNYLPLTGGTMTGNLVLKGGQYNREGALNCNNSDIINVNSILTADEATNFGEGLCFYRSASTWDCMSASNGIFYFGSNKGYGDAFAGDATIKCGELIVNSLAYFSDYIRIGQGGNIIDGYKKSTSAFTNLHLNYYSNGNTTLSYGGGNVGIGTNSPAYKLDVNGDINSSSCVRSKRFLTKASSNADYAGLCAGNQITGSLTADDGALYYYGKKLWVWATELRLEGGNIVSTGAVTALVASASDKRLKKEIKPFDAKQIIDKLNPVEFEWNRKANKYNSNLELNKKNYGLIAQDSDGIINNLVFDLPDGKGYKGVRYEKLIPILLQAVKEQQKEIDELKQIIKKLKV